MIPGEVRELVKCLQELARQRSLVVAMGSTGTYGDALRQALTDAGLSVHRVSGKATSDYAEVFDGVPSAHDGKDAAVVAELAAIGKSTPWPLEPDTPRQAEMSAEVIWLDMQQSVLQLWLGRLEALLARHWPEALHLLGLTSVTLQRAFVAAATHAVLHCERKSRRRAVLAVSTLESGRKTMASFCRDWAWVGVLLVGLGLFGGWGVQQARISAQRSADS